MCGARQGRQRKTARNCAWARPKANRARANAARHPCAGMETARHAAVVRAGAHWPQTPRKRRPLHARYLYYIISARPAQASAGTARQNLQRRNRQAEPYCRTRRPRRSKKICLPPLTMPQPHAILIKFPAGKTSYRGVEQMVARRAHNPEVAGSSPVPATILIGRFYCRPIFYCCIAEYWRLRACRVQAFSITVTSVFGRFWQ